jgi:hypothetical protein
MSPTLTNSVVDKYRFTDVSRPLIQSHFQIKKHFSQFFTAIPIMDRHCLAESKESSTKSPTYVDGQNDVRDTKEALLNCLRASVFTLIRSINCQPFCG